MYSHRNRRYRYGRVYRGRRRRRNPNPILKIIILLGLIAGLAVGVRHILLKNVGKGDNLEPTQGTTVADGTVITLETEPELEIEPFPPPVKVRGIYVTGWTAGIKERMSRFIEICDTTEVNSLIIDIKDDRGQITFISETGVGSAANMNIIPAIYEVAEQLKEHEIYAIARIVCFNDPIKSSENPALAIHDKSGNLWKDVNGNSWLNPYNIGAWKYIVDVAKEAAVIGFDEVQFDYVRFPSDGKLKEIDYGEYSDKSKSEAINEFLAYARGELAEYRIRISADIFGIIAINRGDLENIGQDLEEIAQNSDYICPMIYPSHFANKRQNGVGQNINGIVFEAPDKEPYGVVYNILLATKNRLEGIDGAAIVRPYLQDFTASYLGAGYYQKYGAQQVREQIEAVYDAGYDEWILWNASSSYNEGAFEAIE